MQRRILASRCEATRYEARRLEELRAPAPEPVRAGPCARVPALGPVRGFHRERSADRAAEGGHSLPPSQPDRVPAPPRLRSGRLPPRRLGALAARPPWAIHH